MPVWLIKFSFHMNNTSFNFDIFPWWWKLHYVIFIKSLNNNNNRIKSTKRNTEHIFFSGTFVILVLAGFNAILFLKIMNWSFFNGQLQKTSNFFKGKKLTWRDCFIFYRIDIYLLHLNDVILVRLVWYNRLFLWQLFIVFHINFKPHCCQYSSF